ncbi:sodium:solute symporter [Salisaeta longa]|uniref:sodium:solute symporter n=1 Tax=Salisaeta longa TaxID=503170 RepID=UPI0003B46B0A|nr:sodium:solute symporter [Salisaeta longa]
MDLSLGIIDWSIIALYFLVVFGVAAWATIKERSGEETSADYFLAGRNVGWFVVGASLFASNIGSEHLIGLAGTGASSGVAVGQFEVLASLILLLLGWVFVPFYIKSGVFTMPEFLEKRYSSGARWYLATISIVGYVLTKISVTIFAGGVVFDAIGVPFWTGAFIVVGVTGLYTILGGLRAVLYTDLMQVFVLIGGSVMVTLIGISQLGGWTELQQIAGESFFDMWLPMTHPDFPWTGILFGAPILGIWYWCTDQFIVQRTLSAKNEDHARRGSMFAGYLKLLPVFIFVLPGIVAYALQQQGLLTLEQPDQALPVLVGTLLPVGLRGIVVAGLLAALMSSLSSVFNSCSTLVTWDVYRELKPDATERQLVWVGRLATVGLTVLGLAWIPLMDNISGQLYTYLQSVQGYIAPPIAAVFLLGVFWQRVNAKGALASLGTGFVLGATRLILELINGAQKTGLPDGSVWAYVAEINFLHLAFFLFLICVAVLVIVSLLTEPPAREKVAGLTYATADEPVAGQETVDANLAAAMEGTDEDTSDWRRVDLGLTLFLLALVGMMWWYFS